MAKATSDQDIAVVRQTVVDCHERLAQKCGEAIRLANELQDPMGYAALLPEESSFEDYNGETIRHLEGADAVAYALKMVALLNYDGNNQQTSKVRLLPGIVGVNRLIYECLMEINGLKAEFQSLWSSLNQEYRKQIKQGTPSLSRICTLHIYRKVDLLRHAPLSAKFNWHIASNMRQVTRDETVQFLENNLNNTPKNTDTSNWRNTIMGDIADVSEFPSNEVLLIKEKGREIPVVSLVYPKKKSAGKKQLTQSMPAFYLIEDDKDITPPIITPLGELSHYKSEKRPNMIEKQPINGYLGIYRYKPEHRFALSENPIKATLELDSDSSFNPLSLNLHTNDELNLLSLNGNCLAFVKCVNKVIFNNTGEQINKQSIVWTTDQTTLRFYAVTQKFVFMVIRRENENQYYKIALKELKQLFSRCIENI